tara:strand:+ start:12812 stop:13723 length:912 start_codon:yes stop_codon:yes gene_type:complete
LASTIKNNNTFKEKIRLWLLDHPNFNPFNFSIKKLYRKITSGLRTYPDFIIIGAGRAGTTALYSYLIQHPKIIPAYINNSEDVADLHFFEYMISDNIQWYKSHFPISFSKSKTHSITGEFTSTYMYHPDVPKRIFNLLPKIKLIVILRNPIDKAYATYQQQFRFGEITSTFQETINAEFRRMDIKREFPEFNTGNHDFENSVAHNIIRHGIYANYLKTWFEIFDKNQILILNSEDLKNSTKETLKQIFNFLNISDYEISDISPVNVGKYPPIDNITRQKLINFFKPHNQRLNELLTMNLNWDD